MLLTSVTLKNKHTIPLKSLNLIIGPNNSGKSSFLMDLQDLKDTGLLLESVSPPGLEEAQIKDYLDSINNYSIPSPGGGVWNKDSWEEAESIVRISVKPRIGGFSKEKVVSFNNHP